MVSGPDTTITRCSLRHDLLGIIFWKYKVENDTDIVPGEDEEVPEDFFEYVQYFVSHC